MIERALDVVLTPPVETCAQRCSRASLAEAARTSCRACLDACPVDAIALDPVTVQGDACDGCDRCVAVCPTGALSPNSKRRKGLLGELSRVNRGANVELACRVSEASSGAISVNCVATIDPWSIIVCLLVGAARVELCHGDCGACPHGEGALDRLAGVVDTISRVGRALSLGVCVTRAAPLSCDELSQSRVSGGARKVSRRGLLRGWLRSGQDTAMRVMTDDVQGDDLADVRLRDLAATLLAGRRLSSTPISGRGLGGRPRVADTCTRCAACVSVCPTDALSQGKLPDTASAAPLALFAARCTACQLCVHACPEGAIAVDDVVDLAECAPRPIKLLEPLSVPCIHCGGVGLAPFLPVCTECYGETSGRLAPATARGVWRPSEPVVEPDA